MEKGCTFWLEGSHPGNDSFDNLIQKRIFTDQFHISFYLAGFHRRRVNVEGDFEVCFDPFPEKVCHDKGVSSSLTFIKPIGHMFGTPFLSAVAREMTC